jgi:8-oxo-dGTP pyrophosphatase MutT (NUDIX family)
VTGRPAAPDVFGSGWERAADGVWQRRAARVVLVGSTGRVLLLHGYDVHDPSIAWWFTVGGGLDGDEDERAAAVREVREETGLVIGRDVLVGPVAVREPSFPYFGQACRQREAIFFAGLDGEPAISGDGWTDVERASVDRWRWWSLEQLDTTAETVYPPGLTGLVRDLLGNGWDGITRTID